MYRLVILGFALSLATSCKTRSFGESNVAERDSEANPLTEQFGVRVNLSTNMATFYENGKPIRKWKVATARDDGLSMTPPGTYRFHELTTCVRWTFTRPPFPSAGPCADDNPLGFRAMWFNTSEYGLHGVDEAHISSVTAPNTEGRRQSSGCVRNHPNDIKWLTDKAAPLYGTNPIQLAADVATKSEKTYKPVGKGLALEIGRWPTDPEVDSSDSSNNEPSACTTANATGFLSTSQSVDVFDTDGKLIGKSKPFEPVCPTVSTTKGKTQVFFPMDPSGFGWIDSNVLRQNCKGNQKWKTLSDCLKTDNPSQCASLCSPSPVVNLPPVVQTPPPCSSPKLDALKDSGKVISFMHGEGNKYEPRSVLDMTTPRKDGLKYKLGLTHSSTDTSNLAFDTSDQGQTIKGFRYNISWDDTNPKTKKIDFTATWKCDRWVGSMGSEPATLIP